MKVAEFLKQLEAKAAELRDVINALLKLTSGGSSTITIEDKRRHVVVLYTEYLRLSAELSDLCAVSLWLFAAEPNPPP